MTAVAVVPQVRCARPRYACCMESDDGPAGLLPDSTPIDAAFDGGTEPAKHIAERHYLAPTPTTT